MARVRSPNYPSIGLGDAIEKIAKIYEKEQHLAAPREVVVQHLGYASLNGSSLAVLSALLKYGLLEKTKDDKRKVTALALKILHPRDEAEKSAAIREAGTHPAIFVGIAKEWPEGNPSDANIKAYLLRQNFSLDAIPEVIKAYRGTMKLVTSGGEEYNPPGSDHKDGVPAAPETPMGSQARQIVNPQSNLPPKPVTPAERGDPFTVTFTGRGLEIVARIVSAADADELIRAVNALKLLLRPANQIKRPESASDDTPGDQEED